jgi:hypothetical protein
MISDTFKHIVLGVVFRHTVSRAFNIPEQLRQGYEKVEYLWYKKQQHSLGKVAEYPSHSKGHASEIAISIPDKDFGRVFIVLQQS